MARLKLLETELGRLFRAPRVRPVDVFRRSRGKAKKLAARHGLEIEQFREGGMNVYPPSTLDEHADPYAGDHYASDWDEALTLAREYARLCPVLCAADDLPQVSNGIGPQ